MKPPGTEHPFARYVRILGKGKTGSRSLSFEEARSAFLMVLEQRVEPVQLGAFLMLLRVKEETAEELAGFVTACREHIGTPPCAGVDLDWPSYAGKRNQHPWYLLSALLLADNGVRIVMHGADGHTPGRAYAAAALDTLGIAPAKDLADASRRIQQCCFAFLPLRQYCPPLHDIVQLKPILGLRSPVNTLARMLNPLRADYSIRSIFHPNYGPLHSGADRILGQPHSLVFKGEGGEVEIKPHARTVCRLLRGSDTRTFPWERVIEEKPRPVTAPGSDPLKSLWSGAAEDRYGEAAVCETAAAALLLLQRADTPAAARTLAADYWSGRDRQRF